MEKNLSEEFDNLSYENTSKIDELNINYAIDSETLKKIEAKTFEKLGFEREKPKKQSFLRPSFYKTLIAAAACLVFAATWGVFTQFYNMDGIIPSTTHDTKGEEDAINSVNTVGSETGETTKKGDEQTAPSTTVGNDAPVTDNTGWEENKGGIYECEIHHWTYHVIAGSLLDYLGITNEQSSEYVEWLKEEYREWYTTEHYQEYGCNRKTNIMEFIDYFDVSREDLEYYYYWLCGYYEHDFPIDLLYTDKDAAEEYFQAFASREEDEKLRSYEMDFYRRLKDCLYDLGVKEMRDNSVKKPASIPELILKYDLPRAEAEKCYSENAERYQGLYKCDFDKIYEMKDKIETLKDVISPVELNISVRAK